MRIAIVISIIFCAPAFATLGEREESITSKATKMAFQLYTRHESAVPKIAVREFADRNGKIFAVTWRGKTHPDLSKLLGAHLAEFESALTAARKVRRGHSPIEIETGNIHVEMGGSGRLFYGRIWLIDQIPGRVNTGEIN